MPNKILIVVDAQVDFVSGCLGTPEAKQSLSAVAAKIKEYRDAGHAILFTRDTHQENYLDTAEGKKLPVPHCIEGTPGWEIEPSLWYENMMCLDKSTFGSIDLPHYLASYDEIEFVGYCTDICVVSNVLLAKAHYPEKRIVIDSTCCAGVTPETHEAALTTMRSCQIEVI